MLDPKRGLRVGPGGLRERLTLEHPDIALRLVGCIDYQKRWHTVDLEAR